MFTYRSTSARLAVAGFAVVGLAAAGCSSSSSSSSSSAASSAAASSPAAAAPTSASASASATGTGPVNVLYAGSLVNLMTKQIGPAFTKASGYTVTGESAGSTALVTDIKGKVDKGDVFISASPKATATLMGSANGDWVSWYVSYASSTVVLGYSHADDKVGQHGTPGWVGTAHHWQYRLGLTQILTPRWTASSMPSKIRCLASAMVRVSSAVGSPWIPNIFFWNDPRWSNARM